MSNDDSLPTTRPVVHEHIACTPHHPPVMIKYVYHWLLNSTEAPPWLQVFQELMDADSADYGEGTPLGGRQSSGLNQDGTDEMGEGNPGTIRRASTGQSSDVQQSINIMIAVMKTAHGYSTAKVWACVDSGKFHVYVHTLGNTMRNAWRPGAFGCTFACCAQDPMHHCTPLPNYGHTQPYCGHTMTCSGISFSDSDNSQAEYTHSLSVIEICLGSPGFAHWLPQAGLLRSPGGPSGGKLEGGQVPRVP